MDDDKEHPWITRWVHAKWPVWTKWVVVGSGICAWIGTFMGWGGYVVRLIHSHDVRVQAEALAVQLDKQHDQKVDQTLDDHTRDIKETKAGVAQIQNTLAKQDVELLGTKDQLNRIESAIMNGNRPSIAGTPP